MSPLWRKLADPMISPIVQGLAIFHLKESLLKTHVPSSTCLLAFCSLIRFMLFSLYIM